jgi:hypothetical protein
MMRTQMKDEQKEKDGKKQIEIESSFFLYKKRKIGEKIDNRK